MQTYGSIQKRISGYQTSNFRKDTFQKKLKEDVSKTKQAQNFFVFAD